MAKNAAVTENFVKDEPSYKIVPTDKPNSLTLKLVRVHPGQTTDNTISQPARNVSQTQSTEFDLSQLTKDVVNGVCNANREKGAVQNLPQILNPVDVVQKMQRPVASCSSAHSSRTLQPVKVAQKRQRPVASCSSSHSSHIILPPVKVAQKMQRPVASCSSARSPKKQRRGKENAIPTRGKARKKESALMRKIRNQANRNATAISKLIFNL